MELFTVVYATGDTSAFIGVFATAALAEDAIKKCCIKYELTPDYGYCVFDTHLTVQAHCTSYSIIQNGYKDAECVFEVMPTSLNQAVDIELE